MDSHGSTRASHDPCRSSPGAALARAFSELALVRRAIDLAPALVRRGVKLALAPGLARRFLVLAPALALLACDPPKPEPTVELTRRQKDSVVARSGLPGAKGVEKALNVLQATEDRAAALEQATR